MPSVEIVDSKLSCIPGVGSTCGKLPYAADVSRVISVYERFLGESRFQKAFLVVSKRDFFSIYKPSEVFRDFFTSKPRKNRDFMLKTVGIAKSEKNRKNTKNRGFFVKKQYLVSKNVFVSFKKPYFS